MTVDVVTRAQQLLAAGQTADALRMLEVERERGAGPAVHGLLGYACYQDNRIGDARLAIEAGLKLFPFDAALHEAMARMRWLSGEGEHFAAGFLAAVAARPDDLALRLKCADLLRLATRYDDAERLLREALVRNPDDVTSQAWMAVLLDEMGQFDEAAAMYRNAVRTWPNEPVLRLNLSHTLMRMGRADEALGEIGPVRRDHPALQLAITYEADALRQLGDARAQWICNYQQDVKAFDIAPPRGFASVEAFNAAFAARLRELHGTSAHPLEQSLRGGSQSSQNLLQIDGPLIHAYVEALGPHIAAYVSALPRDAAHPLYSRRAGAFQLQGCWSVLLKPDGFHVNHTHPAGWISSSYYVSLPSSVNDRTQEGWIKFGEPRWPISGCGVERTVQPKEGRVVLFPSYMWHGTIPFSSGERLTAPFDVVPVGTAQ
jgi:tetratricopeptide (TPR) repeat protein